MSCEDLKKAMADFAACEPTSEGARVATHCLYPSFEPVRIYVAKVGDGFHVHDGGGAFTVAWIHGRDEPTILSSIRAECARFHLKPEGRSILAKVESLDWLASAIVTVANASSFAAHDAVAKIVAAAEEALVDRIEHDLQRSFGHKGYLRGFDIRGASGGKRHFDFIIGAPGNPNSILVNGVSPHRNSISSKYVSFADTEVEKKRKFAVFDRELSNDDTVLLQQVAQVVPLASLKAGAERSLHG